MSSMGWLSSTLISVFTLRSCVSESILPLLVLNSSSVAFCWTSSDALAW